MKNNPNSDIKNWKQFFRPKILARGQEYYHSGQVRDMWKTDHDICACVSGSKRYWVEIGIHQQNIVFMSCSCPYAEDGDYCKHMAAVLYAVTSEPQTVSKESDMSLDQALEILPHNELAEIMRRLAETDNNIKQYLIRAASSLGNEQLRWKLDLEMILAEYADEMPSLDYDEDDLYDDEDYVSDASYACASMMTDYVQQRFVQLITEHRNIDAAALIKLLYEISQKAYSEGLSVALDEIEIFCQTALEQFMDASPSELKEIYLSLRALCTDSQTTREGEVMEEIIAELDWSPEILREHLVWLDENLTDRRLEYRIEIMKKIGADISDVIAYLEQQQTRLNVLAHLLPLYEIIDYRKAIDLLRQSRNTFSNQFVWLSYTEKILSIFESHQDKEEYRAELEHLVLNEHYHNEEYLEKLRDIMDEDTWRDTFLQVLNHTTGIYDRLNLLVFEKMYDELLMELMGCDNLPLYLQYEKYLKKLYPEQMLDLYIQLLNYEMKSAYNRSGYRTIISHLKKLKSYPDGKDAAWDLAREWHDTYHNRSAMMDELKKAGYQFQQ